MEVSKINPKDIIFALDIGTRSIVGTVGIVRDKKFHVAYESYIEHEERAMLDGQIHDINLVANGVSTVKRQLEKNLGFSLCNVAIAAAGRFLRTTTTKAEIQLEYDREIDKDIIRSLELTAVKNAEQEINKSTSGKLYCVGYSVKNYYLNDYIITNLLSHKGENAAVEIIATFLPRSVVESLYAVMDKVQLNVVNLTLEPIAAMEAAIPKSLRLLNLALIDIGAGTSDIAISSKDSISAFGMVSTAGDEVTEAIAQNFLVDFNTAEKIKKECSIKDTIKYCDVLGLENEIASEEVIRVITPVTKKICEEIGKKVIELNGGKSPNAVFLVGGGVHTPKLKEILAEELNLSSQRIAIKGRDAVSECVCPDNNLGSIGVTVLGIALVSIMKLGHDFIDVTLNGRVISLFNSSKHAVSDVLVQAGINPKVLIGKNGRNIRFNLNGVKRIAFGTLASNSQININGIPGSIDSEVKEGDSIEIDFAKDGKDAETKILDYIRDINIVSFYLNDIITFIEPLAFINDKKVDADEYIKEGDHVNIIFSKTLADFKYYFETKEEKYKYYLNDIELEDSYIICEGDRIYSKRDEDNNLNLYVYNEHNNSLQEIKLEETDETIAAGADRTLEYNPLQNDYKNTVEVNVNNSKVYLNNKERYIFIDIFDFIDFDLTRSRGNLILLLNGKKAGYYDELANDDDIKVYWK